MCVDVACVRASEVCWFGFEGGLLGATWVLEGVECMCGIVNISAVNKRTNLTYAAFSGLSSSLR